MYRITIDREACDGIFACLVRDGRVEEDSDGLATLGESDGLAAIEVDDEQAIAARFDDDRRDEAESAAAACPVDAISVEEVEP